MKSLTLQLNCNCVGKMLVANSFEIQFVQHYLFDVTQIHLGEQIELANFFKKFKLCLILNVSS